MLSKHSFVGVHFSIRFWFLRRVGWFGWAVGTGFTDSATSFQYFNQQIYMRVQFVGVGVVGVYLPLQVEYLVFLLFQLLAGQVIFLVQALQFLQVLSAGVLDVQEFFVYVFYFFQVGLWMNFKLSLFLRLFKQYLNDTINIHFQKFNKNLS